jgi:hypothetical protein
VLLGVIVVAQFVLIPISNVAGYLDRDGLAKSPPITAVRTVADRYCEATGQVQGWAMFDAGWMANSVSWDVCIELTDGSIHRVAGVAPLPGSITGWTPPAALIRRFVYESFFSGMDLVLPNGVEQADLGADFQAAFQADVRDHHAIYRDFFKAVYARERRSDWPERPRNMELAILRRVTADPNTGLTVGDQVRYVARWRPDADEPGLLAVEAYDPDAPGVYRRFASGAP